MTNKIKNAAELVEKLRKINGECAEKGFVQQGNDAQRWLNYSKQLMAAKRRLNKLASLALRDGELTLDEYSNVVC